MIDFRYHLVSLISVFLALAVGIVLGAGPLRDTIGETLTGQVQDLRVDRERLRAELEASEIAVGERNEFIDATAPTVLADLLPERQVAVVTLPGTQNDDVDMIRERIEQAGAQVVAEVAVTEAWTDPDTRSFRQTFAGQLLGYLAPAPAQDASTEEIFGVALGQALTGTEGVDGEGDAETLLDLLVSADTPLATVTSEPSELADATVLVGPPPEILPQGEETPDAEAQQVAEERRAAHRELAAALAGSGEGSVTVGAAETAEDLVAAIRSHPDAGDTVTTVDSVGEVTAGVATPMALAVAMSGTQGHYGSQLEAEEPVPPYSPLPAPTSELDPPEEPGTSGDEGILEGELESGADVGGAPAGQDEEEQEPAPEAAEGEA